MALDPLVLPDGLTWDDVAGRTWDVSNTGGLVLFKAASPRKELQETILANFGDILSVTVGPPETLAPPAVVIRPADPYQAPYTSSGVRGSAWAFELDLVVHRNLSEMGLTDIERIREAVCAVLPPGWRWLEFGDVGEIEVAGKVYLKGTLGVAVALTGGLDGQE